MPAYLCRLLACLVLLCGWGLPTAAAHPPVKIKGKVVRVIDGDTFEVLEGRRSYRVRLNAIDAPEKGQAFYQVSRQALAGRCFGKTVSVVLLKKDRYQRWLGDVYDSSGVYINGWMIAQGYAWHYRYSRNAALAQAQNDARRQRRGLWSQPQPVAPWLYRADKRNHVPAV